MPARAQVTNKFPVDRSREFWSPDQRWLGDTAFILGGGPSLAGFDCRILQDYGWILAINSSFRLAPYCDAVFFSDHTWWNGSWEPNGSPRKKALIKSGVLLVTTSRAVKRDSPDHVKRVSAASGQPLKAGHSPIRLGRNSGQTGIALAAAFGAKQIVLLGFDMRRVAGESHHHKEYSTENDKLYSKDFIPAFQGWNNVAVKSGIKVLNATPGSALNEFPKIELREILK